MISPQELQSKKFEKAVFGGYDMAGIDEFLDVLIPDYTALFKENMTLKNKMKVLVDKIEEYRSVDEEMRKALYQAQVSSKEIIQKAQSESEQMLAAARAEADRLITNAHAEAEGRVADMQQAIAAEQNRLEEAREVSSTYARTVIELLKKSISAIDVIAQKPAADYAPQAPAAPGYEPAPLYEPAPAYDPAQTRQPEADPAFSETRVFETDLSAAPPAGDEEDTMRIYGDEKPRFKFENLKFGKDYQPEDELKD